MIIKRIKINNIRSYKEEEINFPIGSTLLSGDIGSGKTSVLLAIEFALFGLQPGQRGSSLLSNDSEEGGVIIEIDVDGNKVLIERKLKRNSKTISQDYAAITLNGVKNEMSVTELKTKVLEILNYPNDFVKKTNLLYKYTVYTPQEEMKQIILEDVESRLNILRHIFGVDKYKRIRENLQLLNLKFREQTKLLQGETSGLEELEKRKIFCFNRIELLKKEMVEKKNYVESVKNMRRKIEGEIGEIKSKIEEKRTFEKEIEKTTIVLNNKNSEMANQKKEIEKIVKKLAEKKEFEEDKLNELVIYIQDRKKVIEQLNLEQLDFYGKMQSIKSLMKDESEKKKRIFRIDICPTCLQEVSEVYKTNILNDVENKEKNAQRDLKFLEESLNKISTNLKSEKQALDNLIEIKSKMDIAKSKIQEYVILQEREKSIVKSIESLDKDIDFLKKHIIFLKNSVLEFQKYDNYYNLKEQELKKVFVEERKAEINFAEIAKEKELIEREVIEISKKIDETEEKKKKLLEIAEIEKWLSEDFVKVVEYTERNILGKLKKEFAKLFNKWFGVLTNDSLSVQLDENFSPVILQGEFELDYSYLSGGERTAIALAYRLALNQIINSLLSKIKTKGLIILDEPTDGFSEQQLDKIRDILQEIKAEQLIIVSHESKIEGFVDNVIKFKKEDGKSRIYTDQKT